MIIGPRPEYPQTTVDKVASAFELDFVYLIDCLSANILISLTFLKTIQYFYGPLNRRSDVTPGGACQLIIFADRQTIN